MFMAADVSQQGRLVTDTAEKNMPSKDIFVIKNDEARQAYINTFGDDEYRYWIDIINKGGPQLKKLVSYIDTFQDRDASLHPKFHHRRVHDAESLFWVLIWVSLLLDPKEKQPEGPHTVRAQMMVNMRMHQSLYDEDSRRLTANRDTLLPIGKWEVILGAKCSSLSAPITSLHSHFAFPWYRVTEFPIEFLEYHGFEVLRRQLLTAIYSLLPPMTSLAPYEREHIMNNPKALKLNRGLCCKWKDEIAATDKKTVPKEHLTVQSPQSGNTQSRAKRQKTRANNTYIYTKKDEGLEGVDALIHYCKLRADWF
jgi:hypothetical protein